MGGDPVRLQLVKAVTGFLQIFVVLQKQVVGPLELAQCAVQSRVHLVQPTPVLKQASQLLHVQRQEIRALRRSPKSRDPLITLLDLQSQVANPGIKAATLGSFVLVLRLRRVNLGRCKGDFLDPIPQFGQALKLAGSVRALLTAAFFECQVLPRRRLRLFSIGTFLLTICAVRQGLCLFPHAVPNRAFQVQKLFRLPGGYEFQPCGIDSRLAAFHSRECLSGRVQFTEFLRGGTRCFRGLLCGDLHPSCRFKLAVQVLPPLLRIVSPLAQFVFRLSLSGFQEVVCPLPGGLDLLFDRFGFGLQLLFNVAEGFGLEQDLQNLFAVARCGGKELPELTLRQKHNLAELVAFEPEQLGHFVGDVGRLGGDDLAIIIRVSNTRAAPQGCRGRFLGGAGAAATWPHLNWCAPDPVRFRSDVEIEGNLGDLGWL